MPKPEVNNVGNREEARKKLRLKGYVELGKATLQEIEDEKNLPEQVKLAEAEYATYYAQYTVEANQFFQKKNNSPAPVKYVLLSDYDQCLSPSKSADRSATDKRKSLENAVKNNKNQTLYSPQNWAYFDAYLDAAQRKGVDPEKIHLARLTSRVNTAQDNFMGIEARTRANPKDLEATGRAYPRYKKLAKRHGIVNHSFSFDDLMYKKDTKGHFLVDNEGNKILHSEKHGAFEYGGQGSSKILQILLHTIHLSEKNPETIVHCLFSDDNQSLLDDAYAFFSENPEYLPHNIRLQTVKHVFGKDSQNTPSRVIEGQGIYQKDAAQRIFDGLAAKTTQNLSDVEKEYLPNKKKGTTPLFKEQIDAHDITKIDLLYYHAEDNRYSIPTEERKPSYIKAFNTDILSTDVPVKIFSLREINALLRKAAPSPELEAYDFDLFKGTLMRSFEDMHEAITRTYRTLDEDLLKHQSLKMQYTTEGNTEKAKLADEKVQAVTALRTGFTESVTKIQQKVSALSAKNPISITAVADITTEGCTNLNRVLYSALPEIKTSKKTSGISSQPGNQLARNPQPAPVNQNNTLLTPELRAKIVEPYNTLGSIVTRLTTFLTSVLKWGVGVSTATRTEKHIIDKAGRFFDAQAPIQRILSELNEKKTKQVENKSEQGVNEPEASNRLRGTNP